MRCLREIRIPINALPLALPIRLIRQIKFQEQPVLRRHRLFLLNLTGLTIHDLRHLVTDLLLLSGIMHANIDFEIHGSSRCLLEYVLIDQINGTIKLVNHLSCAALPLLEPPGRALTRLICSHGIFSLDPHFENYFLRHILIKQRKISMLARIGVGNQRVRLFYYSLTLRRHIAIILCCFLQSTHESVGFSSLDLGKTLEDSMTILCQDA